MGVSTPFSDEDASEEEVAPPPPMPVRPQVVAAVPLKERGLALVIRAVDVVLRWWYGVWEFTSDPECLLRLARARAEREVHLSDGIVIAPGQEVLVLHIWNEQVPRFRLNGGPGFGWAVDIRRRLQHSFHQLAVHLAGDPDTAHIVAIHACASFGSLPRRWQIRRAAARFGFDLVESTAQPSGLHKRGEDVLIWVFTRAFNPGALRRQPFWRVRTELWMSRETLLRLYL